MNYDGPMEVIQVTGEIGFVCIVFLYLRMQELAKTPASG